MSGRWVGAGEIQLSSMVHALFTKDVRSITQPQAFRKQQASVLTSEEVCPSLLLSWKACQSWPASSGLRLSSVTSWWEPFQEQREA